LGAGSAFTFGLMGTFGLTGNFIGAAKFSSQLCGGTKRAGGGVLPKRRSQDLRRPATQAATENRAQAREIHRTGFARAKLRVPRLGLRNAVAREWVNAPICFGRARRQGRSPNGAEGGDSATLQARHGSHQQVLVELWHDCLIANPPFLRRPTLVVGAIKLILHVLRFRSRTVAISASVSCA